MDDEKEIESVKELCYSAYVGASTTAPYLCVSCFMNGGMAMAAILRNDWADYLNEEFEKIKSYLYSGP